MPKIVACEYYNGAQAKIDRLGMTPLWDDLCKILTGFQLLVLEQKDSNGGAAVREIIDAAFLAKGNWKKQQTGGVDWSKCLDLTPDARTCIGVEIQFSGRSDLLIIDVAHLREQITIGAIDVGVIVVPTDQLAQYMTDRGPNFTAAKQAVARNQAETLPLVIIALEHDGPGPALAKKRTRQGRQMDSPQETHD